MNEFKIKPFVKHLMKNKQFSAVTILGFSISLTFVLLLSGYVKQELSVDHFHEKKDRIYRLANENGSTFCPPIGNWLMEQYPEVESFTRAFNNQGIIADSKGKKFQIDYLLADTTFFQIFSFPLLEGNAETCLKSKDQIILSQSFSQKIFPGQSPMGEVLQMGERSYTVTGVIEDFGGNTQLFPSDMIMDFRALSDIWGSPTLMEQWGNCSFPFYILAKENANITIREADVLAQFKEVFWMYTREYAKEVKFEKLTDAYFSDYSGYDKLRQNSKTMVMILLSIVAFILILSIINYINLSVAQTSFRAKETAIKKLMGGTRLGLFNQLILESIFLTFISAMIAFLLALLVEPWFNQLIDTKLSIMDMLSTDVVLVFVAAIVLIGSFSGVFPALILSGFNPLDIVKGTFRRTSKGIYTKALISFQYVVVIVLLVATYVVYQQSSFLLNYDLGYQKENILVIDNTLPPAKKNLLKEEWMRISGVENVSFVKGSPLDGGNNLSFNYYDRPVSFQVFKVDSAFYDIFDISYTRTPSALNKEGIILNRKTIDNLGLDSLPNSFKFRDKDIPVLGVVDNFHFRDLHEELGMMMIEPLGDDAWPWQILIKISGENQLNVIEKVRGVYSGQSNGDPVEIRFAAEEIEKWYKSEKNSVKIVGYFALLSIILSVMGLMAISTYFIQQRIKEIGIRKVNGATVNEIMFMLNWAFIKWVLVAVVIAIPITFWMMNEWLKNFVYRIELSWWMFIPAAFLAIIIAIITISLQTRVAARRNPVEALRFE